MAKYVGKIFLVSNKTLRIRGEGNHYVYVKWYNPFIRMFRVGVITSLEEKKSFEEYSFRKNDCSVFDKNDKSHFVLKRSKYLKLRSGQIEPIPFNKSINFSVWSGFYGTKYLKRDKLKIITNLKIKK